MEADKKLLDVSQQDLDSEMTDCGSFFHGPALVRRLEPFYNERLLARQSSWGMKANHSSPC